MHSQQRGKYTRGRHTVKTVHISSEWQKKQNASFYQVVTTYVFRFKLSLLHKGRAIKWNNWEKKFCFSWEQNKHRHFFPWCQICKGLLSSV